MEMKTGETLRAWRVSANKSQKDLANELGLSAQFISNLETGRLEPTPLMAARIGLATRAPERDMDLLILRTGHLPHDVAGRIWGLVEKMSPELDPILKAISDLRSGR